MIPDLDRLLDTELFKYILLLLIVGFMAIATLSQSSIKKLGGINSIIRVSSVIPHAASLLFMYEYIQRPHRNQELPYIITYAMLFLVTTFGGLQISRRIWKAPVETEP